MSDFIWRPAIVGAVKVPNPQAAVWTPALDYLAPNRLYRIKVKDAAAKWELEGAVACGPDGLDVPPRSGDPVCPGSPYGVLIGKIGGGTADKSGTIFPIGRYCVYKITDPVKPGPLYLGVNDQYEWMTKVQKQIEFEIEVSLAAPPV
jgi:hypothetical protein